MKTLEKRMKKTLATAYVYVVLFFSAFGGAPILIMFFDKIRADAYKKLIS